MKRFIKVFLITITMLMLLLFLIFLTYYIYVNKSNNLNPEETISKYIEYWADDSTLKMKSLESKEAEFVDVIRNSNKGIKIENLIILDETKNEIDEIFEQYEGKFLKEDLKIYRVNFYTLSDETDWNRKYTFNVRLVHEKQGWCVLSLGNI